MTPEQKQRRINEIEERQLYSRRDRDIDFLLSLVKSQEARGDEPDDVQSIRARAYNEIPFSADVYRFDVRRLLHLYPQLRDQAATSVRSACVEKVRAMRDEWRTAGKFEIEEYAEAAERIITALESVSIQEQKHDE